MQNGPDDVITEDVKDHHECISCCHCCIRHRAVPANCHSTEENSRAYVSTRRCQKIINIGQAVE